MIDHELPDTTNTARTDTCAPYSRSLEVDPERIARLEAMTAPERVHAARSGQLTLGELLRWAARYPHDVPLINGEFFFIAQFMPDGEPTEALRTPR